MPPWFHCQRSVLRDPETGSTPKRYRFRNLLDFNLASLPKVYMTPLETIDPLDYMSQVFVEDTARGLYKVSDVEVITPSVEMMGEAPDGEAIMRHLEAAIRTAYKSEDKIGPESHRKIIKQILSLKHESTLEHFSLSFRITTSRGVTHELVRHRLASYTQESTRYVNYGKRKSQVIMPWHLLERSDREKSFWIHQQNASIVGYLYALHDFGWKPQDARGLLTNDLKTEIVTTMNLRSLRHFISLRAAASAHPDMQVIAREVLRICYGIIPYIFQDLWEKFTPTSSEATLSCSKETSTLSIK